MKLILVHDDKLALRRVPYTGGRYPGSSCSNRARNKNGHRGGDTYTSSESGKREIVQLLRKNAIDAVRGDMQLLRSFSPLLVVTENVASGMTGACGDFACALGEGRLFGFGRCLLEPLTSQADPAEES
jgi:hypothetical protein